VFMISFVNELCKMNYNVVVAEKNFVAGEASVFAML
jgi:hypothetical protein